MSFGYYWMITAAISWVGIWSGFPIDCSSKNLLVIFQFSLQSLYWWVKFTFKAKNKIFLQSKTSFPSQSAHCSSTSMSTLVPYNMEVGFFIPLPTWVCTWRHLGSFWSCEGVSILHNKSSFRGQNWFHLFPRLMRKVDSVCRFSFKRFSLSPMFWTRHHPWFMSETWQLSPKA